VRHDILHFYLFIALVMKPFLGKGGYFLWLKFSIGDMWRKTVEYPVLLDFFQFLGT